ncbi:Aliphatic sulfonates import ATP-binding protein SsuB [Streptomyces sp. RB5]|uniref:Aliphatic sulfonates import ATP-binding protein SsuB n=1 Tax=Streptomyces smaragdinus TaxID=2585196 RepID=A0A7K0CE69_9ACTN|nr:ABC transporter ATP-binding protein [Streptomyces smaragdinus]MQY11760.1 Aliphatic sulfonates import ATP-binding protein SsuB [Streptomyces smaragdinus]
MLEVQSLGKTYLGSTPHEAIRDISCSVTEGEFVALVGPSGCGKTTLLRCLSGLDSPTTGEVRVDGARVIEPVASMALVFQEYGRSLYPWLTVEQNMRLPLEAAGVSRSEIRERCDRALTDVGLQGMNDRHPWQLSGGMQQRVAIARAIAYRPRILLMDEPFASVDAQTREDLEDLMLDIRSRYDMTIVFVTHDIEESIYLSDRVIVLSQPPTTVAKVFPVNLPRERDQLGTKSLPEFIELRTAVHRAIRRDEDVTAGALAKA